jgi:gas vesicle protein
MAKFGKLAALLAGGAVVGAGLGLLYAPQPGCETRRMIRHQAKKAQSEANRLARRVKIGVGRVKAAVSRTIPQIEAA